MSVSCRVCVGFMSISYRFHFVRFSFLFHFCFTSVSCQYRYNIGFDVSFMMSARFVSISGWFRLGFMSVSSRFHVCFLSSSVRFHLGFMPVSFRFQFGFMPVSLRFRVGFMPVSCQCHFGFSLGYNIGCMSCVLVFNPYICDEFYDSTIYQENHSSVTGVAPATACQYMIRFLLCLFYA